MFNSEIWLPKRLEEIFPFFADARNLESITPPWLRFEVSTKGSIEMRPGTQIDYRIRLHGIQSRWRTNIEAWEPLNRFIDDQVRFVRRDVKKIFEFRREKLLEFSQGNVQTSFEKQRQ